MESTFANACFLYEPSVFQRSMRNFVRSACVFFEDASNCASSPFTCVTDAYETGCDPCGFAAAVVAAGPDCPQAAAVNTSKKEDRPSEMRRVRFIFWDVRCASNRILQRPPPVHQVIPRAFLCVLRVVLCLVLCVLCGHRFFDPAPKLTPRTIRLFRTHQTI